VEVGGVFLSMVVTIAISSHRWPEVRQRLRRLPAHRASPPSAVMWDGGRPAVWRNKRAPSDSRAVAPEPAEIQATRVAGSRRGLSRAGRPVALHNRQGTEAETCSVSPRPVPNDPIGVGLRYSFPRHAALSCATSPLAFLASSVPAASPFGGTPRILAVQRQLQLRRVQRRTAAPRLTLWKAAASGTVRADLADIGSLLRPLPPRRPEPYPQAAKHGSCIRSAAPAGWRRPRSR
jgi:hypothetical protein